jgi:type II secretion system protein G
MQFTKNNIKGFTLIELLVVITIIGILAVGGTTVYTSQIQKARDTTRLGDVKALQGALEQVFSDMASYPNTQPYTTPLTDCSSSNATNSNMDCVRLLGFMVSLPKDPKNSQSGNNSPLDYTYNVRDIGGVLQQAYEVSTGVENDGNRTSKGGQDGGNDTNRYEI